MQQRRRPILGTCGLRCKLYLDRRQPFSVLRLAYYVKGLHSQVAAWRTETHSVEPSPEPISRLRVRRPPDLLYVTSPIQLFHKASRIAPAGLDLDKELEKNFGPYHLLDIEAVCGSNLLEHLSAFAEQDGLLPVALAINHSGNPHQPRTLLELLDQHRDRVRHLFMRLHQNMLADQLRRHESHRLIGNLILGKIARPVG